MDGVKKLPERISLINRTESLEKMTSISKRNEKNWLPSRYAICELGPALDVASFFRCLERYAEQEHPVIPISGANGKTIDTTFVFMKDTSGKVRFVTGIPAKNGAQ
jgi:hypothetical protein